MEEFKKFLDKLTKMTKETGIVIQDYGDSHYMPRLEGAFEDNVYFYWDDDKERYIGKIGSPYSKEEI